ncbi:MAG: hypothetical protein ACKO5F_00135 [Synechococcus sp.]
MSHPEESHRSPSGAGGEPAPQPHAPAPHTPPPPEADALGNLAGQLRRHSALEDLGPLFGAEAQGRRPAAAP